MKNPKLHPDTRLTHLGRPERGDGPSVVNTPVWRASTITFPSTAMHEASRANRFEGLSYGVHGTPTTRAFETTIAEIEGGHRGIVYPSGMAAIAGALLACLKSGDHVLMPDSVYGSTRRFCTNVLPRFGVEVSYYDPLIGAGIEREMRGNTRVVYTESPGSLTFEVQDIPAIAAVAKRREALLMLDNTWATGLFFRSFDHGVDISIHAGTKYVVGHSDALLGIVVTNEASYKKVREGAADLGQIASPDDIYLALRGLRTMGVRLREHQRNTTAVAAWMKERPEVAEVLYPALPGAPGHELWKRDFLGASGLFAIVLKPCPRAAVTALVDGLELFGIGASWGGFESLATAPDVAAVRTAVPWARGPLIRFHIGLEDPRDLIADLEEGFKRLAAAAR